MHTLHRPQHMRRPTSHPMQPYTQHNTTHTPQYHDIHSHKHTPHLLSLCLRVSQPLPRLSILFVCLILSSVSACVSRPAYPCLCLVCRAVFLPSTLLPLSTVHTCLSVFTRLIVSVSPYVFLSTLRVSVSSLFYRVSSVSVILGPSLAAWSTLASATSKRSTTSKCPF